ncbi:MAG: hypothetical protein V4495_04555, partial [Pseudomonadota bacterium]
KPDRSGWVGAGLPSNLANHHAALSCCPKSSPISVSRIISRNRCTANSGSASILCRLGPSIGKTGRAGSLMMRRCGGSPAATAAQIPLRLGLVKDKRQGMLARSSALVAQPGMGQGTSKATKGRILVKVTYV